MYYKELSQYIKSNDNENANRVVMHELGKSLVMDRENFIEVLNNADINVPQGATTRELIDLFTDNANNKKLLLGASYLINHQHKTVGFDGEEEVSDMGVKSTYKVMDEYFNFVGAIAGALGEGAKLGNTLATNKAQKKYGSQLALDKSQEANLQLIQGAISSNESELNRKQKQKIADAKTLRTLMYVGGGLLAIGIGVLIYKFKK